MISEILKMKKGFTLVEIMIVVAIIGIIIAIAVPAFLRARENARGRACQENLTKIDGAKEQYAIEAKLGNGVACDMASLLTPTVNNQAATLGSGYLKTTPLCPANNAAYNVNNIGTLPTCSYSATAPAWAVPHDIANIQ